MTPDTAIAEVVGNLSAIIEGELCALSSEYWSPRLTSEQTDAELKFRRERISRLRTMREDFENTMFGLERDAL